MKKVFSLAALGFASGLVVFATGCSLESDPVDAADEAAVELDTSGIGTRALSEPDSKSTTETKSTSETKTVVYSSIKK